MLYAGMIIATIAGYVFFCNVSNLDVYLMKPERQHFCVFFVCLHIHFTSLKLMSFNVGKIMRIIVIIDQFVALNRRL